DVAPRAASRFDADQRDPVGIFLAGAATRKFAQTSSRTCLQVLRSQDSRAGLRGPTELKRHSAHSSYAESSKLSSIRASASLRAGLGFMCRSFRSYVLPHAGPESVARFDLGQDPP